MDRDEILKRVSGRTEPWDMIVIGGGATGVGCALDAASRGCDVLLLERFDLGKGTSSRSTKLIHGGVRYLEQGNIALVREALRERGILHRNAPHAVRKTEFIVPCYSVWQMLYYAAGLKIYDLLAGKYSFGRSAMLSRNETLTRLPNINAKSLRGGVSYFDGQFDDSRLLIDIAVTADRHGAAILNYAPVTSLTKDTTGRANGVVFQDSESGHSFTAAAKCVINATGAFCDDVRKMSDPAAEDLVTLSQGVHLVFDGTFCPGESATIVPKTSDGRVLFIIPWQGHTLAGTTDTPIDHAEPEPRALEQEIDFILRTAAGYLAKPPCRHDILSVFTGIRPLLRSAAASSTASLSREHAIVTDAAGMITVTGGKWTTYRKMAEDTVDKAVEMSGFENRACRTKNLPIEAPPEAERGGGRLHSNLPYTRSDVLRAVRSQMARTVEDVLSRRTRALLLNARAAVEISEPVAEIMAEELGKDDHWCVEQVRQFTELSETYSA